MCVILTGRSRATCWVSDAIARVSREKTVRIHAVLHTSYNLYSIYVIARDIDIYTPPPRVTCILLCIY